MTHATYFLAAATSGRRDVETLSLRLEEIRLGLGRFRHHMQKEIYEQPEALLNTMRGRVRRVSEASGKLEVRCDIALIWYKCSRRVDTAIGTKGFCCIDCKTPCKPQL